MITPTILQDTWGLRLAAVYANPEYPTDRLPYVYGHLKGGSGGVSYCPCIDTTAYRYLIADAPIVAAPAETIYADNVVVDPAGYTLTPDWTDGAGRHVAVVTLGPNEAGRRIGYRGKGIKDAGGALIENPLAIAYDLLVTRRGISSSDVDAVSYSRAFSQAAAQGYIAAGVLEDDRSVAYTLAELLGPFLAAAVLTADRRVAFRIETGGLPADGAIAHHFDRATATGVTVTYNRSNIVNQVAVEYCYNGYDLGLQQTWQASDDGSTTLDASSQRWHGAMGPGTTAPRIQARWLRDQTTARAIQAVMVGLWAQPPFLAQFTDISMPVHLEVGDLCGWSWDWLYDTEGQPLRNQYVTIQQTRPDPRARTMAFTVSDTGYYLTRPYLADGTVRADGTAAAGGDRDRHAYRT